MSIWTSLARLGGEARPDTNGPPSQSWIRERRAAFFRDQYGIPSGKPAWSEQTESPSASRNEEGSADAEDHRPSSPPPGVRLITEPGTSQYSQGGSSACGIAALNSIREMCRTDFGGFTGASLKLITRPCRYWSSSRHLEIDQVFEMHVFSSSLEQVGSEFSFLTTGRRLHKDIEQLVSTLSEESAERPAGATLTKPPEIMSLLALNPTTFALFDSHPRPEHPSGAAFLVFRNVDAINEILVEMLSACSVSIFRGKGEPTTGMVTKDQLWRTNTESLLQVLNLRDEIANLKQLQHRARQDFDRRIRDADLRQEQTTSQLAAVRTQCEGVTMEADGLRSRLAELELDNTMLRARVIELEDTASEALIAKTEKMAIMSEPSQPSAPQIVQWFDCVVCMETFGLDALGLDLPCDPSHRACRDCMLGHVESKIQDRQYPVFCPGCSPTDDDAVISSSSSLRRNEC